MFLEHHDGKCLITTGIAKYPCAGQVSQSLGQELLCFQCFVILRCLYISYTYKIYRFVIFIFSGWRAQFWIFCSCKLLITNFSFFTAADAIDIDGWFTERGPGPPPWPPPTRSWPGTGSWVTCPPPRGRGWAPILTIEVNVNCLWLFGR